MAEYTVHLAGNIDKKATADAIAVRLLRSEVQGLKTDLKAVGGLQNIMRASSAVTRSSSPGRETWSQVANAAQRAADRTAAAQEKAVLRADAVRGRAARAAAADSRRSAAEKARNAAQEARDEQKFSAYRIGLNRREHAENVRAAKRAAAAAEKAAQVDHFGRRGFRSRIDSGVSSLGSVSALDSAGGIISNSFGAVVSVVSAGAKLAYDFGKMAVSAQAMRENSTAAFASIYGSTEVGDRLFDQARKMGQLTKFETKDVVGIYNTLAANNFKEDELQKYTWAIADVRSARDPKRAEQFMNALGDARSSKTATWGVVQRIGRSGPGAENMWSELGKITGKGEMGRSQWQKFMRGNTVTRDQVLDAALKAVTHTYDKKTGKLGDNAREQGMGTWEGIISNIGEGMENTLRSKTISAIPALQNFKKVLQSIGELFDSSTNRGDRFEKLVGKFVEDVFLPFGGLGSNTGFALDKILDAAYKVEESFKLIMIDIRDAIGGSLGNPDVSSLEALAGKVAWAVAKGAARGIRDGANKLIHGEKSDEQRTEDGYGILKFFRGGSRKPEGKREKLWDPSTWYSLGAKPSDAGEIVSETRREIIPDTASRGGGLRGGAVTINVGDIHMPDMPGATATQIAQTGGKMVGAAALRQMDAGMRMRVANGSL